ncbi:MAG TPA: hypothetical protein DEA40_05700 [Parvularcula sp.]|nr:hypothetical protein [Parvularcula sp.]
MSEFKPTYAAIPLRALGDDRLSRADLVTLGAVAAHDRFAKNRTGCFASYRRLIEMTRLSEPALKRSIGRLEECGYLRLEANPMDRRRRILFVVYNDDDAATMRGDGRSFVKGARLRLAPDPAEIGISADTESDAPRPVENARPDVEIGITADTETGEIGITPEKFAQQDQGPALGNIFSERDKRLREARFGREGKADDDPPGASRTAAHAVAEAGLWKEADANVSPAEQVALLRAVHGDARPSEALREFQAALQAKGRVA